MEEPKGMAGNGPAQGTSLPAKDISKYVPETRRKPGELGIALVAFLIGALGYYFALGMTSGKFSSPSVFPKLASALIMALSAFNFVKALHRDKPEESSSLGRYLFPADVVVILLLLVAYCVVLPRLHFIASSYLFMVLAMVYLQRGKKILRAVLVSALALAVLVAVFRYLFLVILP